jgi:hypothetical protein
MNIKCCLIAFFIIIYTSIYAQLIFAPNAQNDKLGYDVRIEYFNHLDSAFVVKEQLAEIIMKEKYWEDGNLIFDEPVVVYRFDEQGRRTYVEQSYWLAIGFKRRYNHFYKDSTISVQHEKYNFTDGNKRDAKYIYKYYVLNDSLTTSIEFFYEFDSLVRVNYKDTVNINAEFRRKMNVQKITAITPIEISSAGIELTFPLSDQHMYRNPYDREPEPEMLKDSLGKVTEVHTVKYVRGKVNNVMVLPESSYYIKFNEQWKKVATITKYGHWSNQKLQAILQGKKKMNGSLDDLKCLSDSCIVYRILASNFISGVPQKIDMFGGKENKPNRSYICTIKKY